MSVREIAIEEVAVLDFDLIKQEKQERETATGGPSSPTLPVPSGHLLSATICDFFIGER